MFVRDVVPRYVKNSRGERSVEVELLTYEGRFKCSAPSGKSKGKSEVASYHPKGIERSMKMLRVFCGTLKDRNFIIKKVDDLKEVVEMMRKFEVRHGRVPDAFVVEGPLAGGHLGFKYNDLRNGTTESLESITRQVVEFAGELGKGIPVIAAGGIYTGADIYNVLSWGAKGVQMGTRFVVTDECDASDAFKNEYLRAGKDDIVLIESPVGLPGRAINNDFLKKVHSGGREKFGCNYRCLRSCDPKESPYCIANALVNANRGNLDRGYAFAGTNAYRCDKVVPVRELMGTLREEYSEAAVADGKK